MAKKLLNRFLNGMKGAAMMVVVLLVALGAWAYFGMSREEGVTPIDMVIRVYTAPITWFFCGLFCVGSGIINLLNPDEEDSSVSVEGKSDDES